MDFWGYLWEWVGDGEPWCSAGLVRSERGGLCLVWVCWCGLESDQPLRDVWVGDLIGAIGDGSAGGLEDDATSHLDGMVGEAFVVAAKQRDVDGGGDAVFPSPVH